MTRIRVAAPAKVNLTLHVTGRRADGFHTLDSLVTFAPVADQLRLGRYDVHSLTVEGPEAKGVPADMDNLALRAAHLLAPGDGVAITLTKNLPAASGIGGGSADAAAAWRGVLALGPEGDTLADRIFGMPDILIETQAKLMAALGADIPMCLASRPLRARGLGEKLEFVDLPPVAALLVNPRVPVATPDVFARLENRENAPMPDALPKMREASDLIAFVATCRNDLEAPARAIAPVIGNVLAVLGGQRGCGLARMSGSGATCFGLFADAEDARAAAERIGRDRPDWWVAGGMLGDQSALAAPVPG